MSETYLDYESEERKTWKDIEKEFYKDVEEGSATNLDFISWLDRNYKVPERAL